MSVCLNNQHVVMDSVNCVCMGWKRWQRKRKEISIGKWSQSACKTRFFCAMIVQRTEMANKHFGVLRRKERNEQTQVYEKNMSTQSTSKIWMLGQVTQWSSCLEESWQNSKWCRNLSLKRGLGRQKWIKMMQGRDKMEEKGRGEEDDDDNDEISRKWQRFWI